MANRVVGNVIIVDSAMGNALLIDSTTGNFRNMHVNAFAFWATDTTGRCIFAGASTIDHLISFSAIGAAQPSQWSSFGDYGTFDALKIPVLTAGTAWIYLG